MTLQNLIEPLLKFLKTQKLNSLKVISVFLILFLLMSFYLFPFNDLSDYATTQIYLNTQKNVYAQFDNLELNLLPFPSVSADDLTVDTRQLPQITAQHVVITPSLMSFIKKTPAIDKLVLEGFLGSTTTFKMKNTELTDKGDLKTSLQLLVDQLDLSHLPELISSPIEPKGRVNAEITGTIDSGFDEPPESEFQMQSGPVTLPSFNLALNAFSVAIPDLKFTQIRLKGRLIDEKLNIEELTLGTSKDPLYLRVKGETGLKLRKLGPSVRPTISDYKVRLDLQINKDLESELYFLGFLDSMKAADVAPYRSRFLFRLSAKDTYSVPQPSKITNF